MRFTQLDVFGDGGLTGNPLAVVHNADGLETEQMQALAAWFNLSETAFLVKPTETRADYQVRIFTPSEELPFAGHPTLGSAHAWLAAGGRPHSAHHIVQECGVGLVELRGFNGRMAFAAPPLRRNEPLTKTQVSAIAKVIGVPATQWVAHAWGDNGAPWQMVQLSDAEAVRSVQPKRQFAKPDQYIGLIGLNDPEDPFAYEVRALTPDGEDPVTGSLNAAAAQWLRQRDLASASYMVTQGSALGRHGEIYVDDDGTNLWIGGRARVAITGDLKL